MIEIVVDIFQNIGFIPATSGVQPLQGETLEINLPSCHLQCNEIPISKKEVSDAGQIFDYLKLTCFLTFQFVTFVYCNALPSSGTKLLKFFNIVRIFCNFRKQ